MPNNFDNIPPIKNIFRIELFVYSCTSYFFKFYSKAAHYYWLIDISLIRKTTVHLKQKFQLIWKYNGTEFGSVLKKLGERGGGFKG